MKIWEKHFLKCLLPTSGFKLIDFKDFSNNSFHVVTELTYKNGDDEFRPDITLLDKWNATCLY